MFTWFNKTIKNLVKKIWGVKTRFGGITNIGKGNQTGQRKNKKY